MTMSILHRITGAGLYFGTLLIAWWVIAAAVSQEQFSLASGFFASWFGRLILLGYTWALVHHMLGGIRHLVWDTGRGMEKKTSTIFAHATWIGSVTLTLVIWVAGYMARG
jgi:succinate dehydrogenase / fumarate reductase cytochrome b subunit